MKISTSNTKPNIFIVEKNIFLSKKRNISIINKPLINNASSQNEILMKTDSFSNDKNNINESNTNTNTNSNNITQRFFLTSTTNINYPSINNKNNNDTYFDTEENIIPNIKIQKKKKEHNLFIKKINKTNFVKQLGLPSPINHYKKVNGKSIFNSGKYEIPFLSNIDL